MSDPHEDPVDRPEITPSIGFGFQPINLLKAKGPIGFAPCDPEFYPFIGSIAIAWSFFENTFDDVLGAILSFNKFTEPWRWFNFKNKAKIFAKEMPKCFECYPWVAIYLDRIREDALRLQRRRNLLLHGHLSLRVYSKWSEGEPRAAAVLIATVSRKGEVFSEEFDKDKL